MHRLDALEMISISNSLHSLALQSLPILATKCHVLPYLLGWKWHNFERDSCSYKEPRKHADGHGIHVSY
jgi:hypothetical protein